VSSLRQSGDDPVQHRLQRFVARRGGFDELRRAVGTAPVHAVQHQAMQMYEQLRGAVETWRLRIEHRRQKTRRLMVLEPAALIHQQRKTGGMTLGNPVFAKPLDLP
jgi:hypothetical protein